MGGDGYFDIILLALVAGFILLRLRSVLGRRTGYQPPPRPPEPARESNEDNVVVLPDRKRPDLAIEPSSAAGPVAAGLTRLKVADRTFDEREFVGGAKQAYEMIVTAFAAGDVATLKAMVSPEVLAGFQQAIDARTRAGEKQETIVNAIQSANITAADLRGRMAEVTVKFVSELVNTTRDAKGEPLAGKSGVVETVTDSWTFSRDTSSSDQNWTLIDTSAD
jgi:predicted lipid-binding transport protein (Tim44 family)